MFPKSTAQLDSVAISDSAFRKIAEILVNYTTDALHSSHSQKDVTISNTAEGFFADTSSLPKDSSSNQSQARDGRIADQPCFRVEIQSGGCSGFRYAFAVDKYNPSSDYLIEPDDNSDTYGQNIAVVIDSASFELLRGAQLDYVESIASSGFVVRNNRNQKGGCGCGNSFGM